MRWFRCRGRLGVPGATDLFALTGQAGQLISLALASAGGFTSSPSSRSVALTIFSPVRRSSRPNPVVEQPEPLSRSQLTGVYAIRVSANNLAATGSYNMGREIFLQTKQSPEPAPLACGGFVSGTLGDPGATDLLTLTGQAGQIISLALASTSRLPTSSPSSRSVALTIFAPSGEVVGPTLLSNSQSIRCRMAVRTGSNSQSVTLRMASRFASTRTISRRPAPTASEEHVRRRFRNLFRVFRGFVFPVFRGQAKQRATIFRPPPPSRP